MDVIGVITGDIVNSTSIGPEWRDRIFQSLQAVQADFTTAKIDVKYEMFRGDSFQVMVHPSTATLLIAIAIRIKLISQTPDDCGKKWDARVSVGIGHYDFESSTIVTSDGEAFVLSGRRFDTLKKARLAVQTPWDAVNDELDVSTAFADDIITNTTIKQAVVVYEMLQNHTYTDSLTQATLSETLNDSKANFSLKWQRAKGNLITTYLKRAEKLILTHIR